jgi:hypothetical protein
MGMNRTVKAGGWALALLLAFGAAPLQAKSKAWGNMKHALGWDAMNLTVVESDSAGRATLEREVNGANKVERATSWHGNGKMASRKTTVVSKESGKTLYTEKKNWDEAGNLEMAYEQDDEYKGDEQVKGQIHEQQYADGRLTEETRKKWRPGSGWELVYHQKISYYDDGDMKERVTEEPKEKEKKLETWGERENKLSQRKHDVKKWDEKTESWK